MDRNTRTLIVVLVALVVAGVATLGVARAIRSRPVVEREVARTYVVAAARTLPMGAMVGPADVKLIAWPERSPVPGGFAKIEEVVNRGVVVQVLENEPVTLNKLAPIGSGAGLPPTIPPGMRALSVRVNEVVGVAGFVVPGTHVDVFVTLKEGNNDSATRVVVSNVQVLTAGTRYDQDKSKNNEPIPTSVVTLLLAPDDASRVVLASSEGQIMLTLRNPMDQELTATAPTRTANLFGAPPPPPPREPAERIARPRQVVVMAPPPPPPPAPKPYTVEAIRAAKRSEETIK